MEFNQPADFYYRIAQRMIDDMDYIGALPIMRTAVEKEPDNYEYGISLAEILTELARFEESNRVLFEMIEHQVDIDSVCFFCLGCNFMGMNDLKKAKESFEKYLHLEPEGEYREEIEDFFLFLDAEEEGMQSFLSDVGEDEAYRKAEEGKKLLDAGEYQKAIQILNSIAMEGVEFSYIKNNLALAHYCLKKIEKAKTITHEVLQRDKDNIHANCNMAVFLKEEGKDAEVQKYLDYLLRLRAETTEDVFKIAITMCELKQHDKALQFLDKLVEISPYDEKILFYLAVALYNTQRFKEALILLGDIQKLDYPGVIAEYYMRVVHRTIQHPEQFQELEYIYQVPAEEAREKIRYLNACLQLPGTEFQELWKEDKIFYHTALWGLDYGDENIKLAIMNVIAGFADNKAESVLRSFILKKNQPDSVKNEVFLLLKRMSAKEPYVAYIGGEMVEVKVSTSDADAGEYANEYKQLFALLNRVVGTAYSRELLKEIFFIIQKQVESGKGHDLLQSLPESAAAVTCIAMKQVELPVDLEEISAIFDADSQTVERLAKRLAKWREKN